MKNKSPDRLYIRKSDKDDYASLQESGAPFEGKENKDVFIMAVITGFRSGSRVPLDKKEGYVLAQWIRDSREETIIKAIAVAETRDLNVLTDKNEVYSIAEEYAAGGIKLLKDEVFSGGYGSYVKRLESDLVDDFKKIEKTIK